MVHVIAEAERCLQCRKPMCMEGCPISTEIPRMIRCFREGKVKEAGSFLFENNPLSLVCSLVCDHNRQCEGHCVLGRKGQPVHISSIENYISEACLDNMEIECAPSNGKMIAVIGGALEIRDLVRDGYKAIFIGTGVWRPKKLSVPGESLGNAHFAIDFLANPASYELGEDIAIIGAGNTAMDVARTILRSGKHNVTLYARSLKSDANEDEIEYAKLDGAKIEFGMKPVRIEKAGPVFVRNIFDEDGKAIGSEDEEIHIKADQTFIAISQGPKSKLVNTTEGLKASASGLLLTNDKGETTCEGIFAAGDVVLGAKTVVQAVRYAKEVARNMDEYVKSLEG